MIIDYNIGAHVEIDDECIQIMEHGNRSINAYPSDSFIEKAKSVKEFVGIVTRRFKPGYDMNVSFVVKGDVFKNKELILHMKDNWVKPLDHNYQEIK